MERLTREHLAGVSDEGERVRQRRERLGMGPTEFAIEAKVHRNTLRALENGDSFNRATLAKVERALARLEEEAGIDAPPARTAIGDNDVVEFRVEGILGVHSVVVKGPVRDIKEFEGSIARILQQIARGDTPEAD